MSTPLFTCPPPAALADVPVQNCPFKIDQIVGAFIQRKQATPSFTTTSILLEATWAPLLIETDSTKVIKTPPLINLVINPGEILQEGGNDNTTLDGRPRLLGYGFSSATAELRNASGAVLAALRALTSESVGETNLWAYFFNRFGQVFGILSGSNVLGIDISEWAVGTTGTAGFNADNITPLSFNLQAGWDEGIVGYLPTDFNPRNLVAA